MDRFKGVLFDFGHTLFDSVRADRHCAGFREASGIIVEEGEFEDRWEHIRQRSRQPQELARGRDLSASAHRRCWLELLAPLNDLAPGLAEFSYLFDCSAAGWRPYPDMVSVVGELRTRGLSIGVVSDCGWDIRDVFVSHNVDGLFDSFDLSFEHGIGKPDPRIFESACAKLGIRPEEGLMVGDSSLADGGAAAIGLTTLILPARDRTEAPALHHALALAS